MPLLSPAALQEARTFNETEVRFHFIDPIIRALGYGTHDGVYLKLEEQLQYPYLHFGRRSKKDVPLGKPDYRAGVDGARGSFILEAKRGNAPITGLAVEQAHSYAAHAQVGANYFVLCNGSDIAVYMTLSGPGAPPIAVIPLFQLEDRFHELENILSPACLERNCLVLHDTGLKLADGLGSSVTISSGTYRLADYSYKLLVNGQDQTVALKRAEPTLAERDRELELLKTAFVLHVSGGQARRGEDGRIVVRVQFAGATTHNHEAMRLMGITQADFVTADRFISTDPDNPTIFESRDDFGLLEGTSFPQLFGDQIEVQRALTGTRVIRAAMHLRDGKLIGEYRVLAEQRATVAPGVTITAPVDLTGTCELMLRMP